MLYLLPYEDEIKPPKLVDFGRFKIVNIDSTSLK